MDLTNSCLQIIELEHMGPMIDIFLEPLQYSFMVRALIASVMVGIMCPLLGAFVINREMGFMSDALAHAVMPGMVAAYAIGISPLFGAAPNAILVALLIGYLVRKTNVSTDTSVGILFATLFSVGMLVVYLAGGISISIEEILLGQVLSTSSSDVYLTVSATAILSVFMLVFYKRFIFVGFDFQGAVVSGLQAQKLDYLMLVLISVVIVLALQVVGVILVVGMLITPAAAASLIVNKFDNVVILAIVFGIISALGGLYLSYYLNLPSGPSIALFSSGIFGIGFVKKILYR